MRVPPGVPRWERIRRRRPASGTLPGTRSRTPIPPYEIHASEYGEGERAIVLLHGLSGSGRWWARNIPELAERYRVLVPDLIGFGRSICATDLPTPGDLAEVLALWLRETGVDRVHLVGHSMGGQVAVHLAGRFPGCVDRLILVDAAGLPRPLTPARVVRFATEIAPVWRWGDPTFLPTIVGDAWTAGPRVLAQAIGHILRDDVGPMLGRIEAPTLVIWGEHDRWVPVADGHEMRARIPDARMTILRGAGHNPMVDRPRAFNRLLLRFLDGEPVGR